MSLEQALAENTAAIKELIAVLKSGKPEQSAPEPEKKTRTSKKTEQEVFYYRAPDGTAFRTVNKDVGEGYTPMTEAEYEEAKAAFQKKTEQLLETSTLAEHGKTAQQAVEALDNIAKVEVTVDYPSVIKVLTAYSKTHGRQGLLDLLAKFGAKTVPELKPEQYAAVVAAAEQV